MFCPRSRYPLAFGQSIHLRSIGTLCAAISSLIPSASCQAVFIERAVREARNVDGGAAVSSANVLA
jgi:hypothetical protein